MLSLRLVLLALILPASAGTAVAPGPAVLRINGVSLATQWRVLEGAPEELVQRLEGRWGARLPDLDAPAAGVTARRLLGRQRGSFHETLTLSPGPRAGTSLALVAVQDLRRRPAPLPQRPLVLPAAARLLNVIEFGEPGGPATAWTFDLAGSTGAGLEAIVTAAQASGWQGIVRPQVASGRRVLWARRGAEELAAVAIRSATRTRLVLLVTPPAAGAAP